MKISWDSTGLTDNARQFLRLFVQNINNNSNKYQGCNIQSVDNKYSFKVDSNYHLHFSKECLQIKVNNEVIKCLEYDGLKISLINSG